jgi:hypothetical protein
MVGMVGFVACVSFALPAVAQSNAGPPVFERPGAARQDRPAPRPSAESDEAPESAPQPVRPGTEPGAGEPDAVATTEPRVRPAPPMYELIPIPDRWRIVESLGVNERLWNPYDQNTLKGDRPLPGTQDWFVSLRAVSDTLVEPSRFPIPVAVQGTAGPNRSGIFGDGTRLSVQQTLLVSASLIKGDTTFRPPDWEFRFTVAGNVNYLQTETLGSVDIDPTKGDERTDTAFGIQEAFIDRHLFNLSDRYDFASLRVGIQPFISDFRGFLLQDELLGVRLFGNAFGNRMQYNFAWFRRLEKDTNSGLNEVIDPRSSDLFFANLYYQDFPVLGFELQGIIAYERNRESDSDGYFNENGFLERPAPVGDGRPHDYDAVYLGLNGDGHFGRLNLTFSFYSLLGEDERSPISGRKSDLRAFFAALEASVDIDWIRLKAFALYASGDDEPQDDVAGGFDAIFENPRFAGAETSFWQRQAIPFIGGGGVALSGRNSLLPALRTSKEQGQSNFVNPGLVLVGAGADFDILPELRLSTNVSYLRFDQTDVLSLLRVQESIDEEIGWDLSASLLYRPLFSENIVLRFSGAVLVPGEGLQQLFDDSGATSPYYSIISNLVLTF